MSVPTIAVVAETWFPCKNYIFTVGVVGSGTIYSCFILDGGVSDEYDVDEFTNNLGVGGYDDLATTYKVGIDITIGFEVGQTPLLVNGAIYPVIIDGGVAGTPYWSGNARISKFDMNVFKVKEGLKPHLTATFLGAVTRVRPS